MKIAYLTTSLFPSRAAHVVHISQMCRSMTALGHSVALTGCLAPDASESELNLGQNVRFFKMASSSHFAAGLRQRSAAKSMLHLTKPDIVITRQPVLAHLAAQAGFSTIMEIHSLPRPGSRNEADLFQVVQHSRLAKLVVISQLLADDFVTAGGKLHERAEVLLLHDGAVPGKAPSIAPANNRPKAGYFGHLYPGKGMETIFELATACPALDFEVYGGEASDIEGWRTKAFDRSNLTIHGHVQHDRVRELGERCDMLLAPYAARVEDNSGRDIGRWMSPLKIFEYMSMGRPIVCSNLPVLTEVLEDGVTALLCEPGNVEDWSAAIHRLAGDPELRTRLGNAGRKLLEQEYSWDRRARRMLEGVGQKVS